jgi:hypothetical protein
MEIRNERVKRGYSYVFIGDFHKSGKWALKRTICWRYGKSTVAKATKELLESKRHPPTPSDSHAPVARAVTAGTP